MDRTTHHQHCQCRGHCLWRIKLYEITSQHVNKSTSQQVVPPWRKKRLESQQVNESTSQQVGPASLEGRWEVNMSTSQRVNK